MKKRFQKPNRPAANGAGTGITITFAEMIAAVSAAAGAPSPFQILRRQPLPMSRALQLIEMAKAIDGKVKVFAEMRTELQQRHFGETKKPTAAARAAFEKDFSELMTQEVSLPGTKLPRAIASEARISADALELLLWLFEPA